jgi:FkbM family methyltransferase
MTQLTQLFADAYPKLELRMPSFENGFFLDIIGSVTDPKYIEDVVADIAKHRPEYDVDEYLAPALNGDFADWAAVFDAAASSQGPFRMLELGAGYGRWSAIGALAAQRLDRSIAHLGLFEAEPSHHAWALVHMPANGFSQSVTDIQWTAVGGEIGSAMFYVGAPSLWWGQSLAEAGRGATTWPVRMIRKLFPALDSPMKTVCKVPMTTLRAILEAIPDTEMVDLVHMDVQGSEADVIAASLETVTARVRNLFIGTHGPQTTATEGRDVSEMLREMLSGAGWKSALDISPDSPTWLNGEKVLFDDGAQIWRNPADTGDHTIADKLLERIRKNAPSG